MSVCCTFLCNVLNIDQIEVDYNEMTEVWTMVLMVHTWQLLLSSHFLEVNELNANIVIMCVFYR
jgi:hypothetical protein